MISFTLLFVSSIVCVFSDTNLTVVHINDFHSHWLEFNEHESICTEEESKAGKCFGGFPRLLHLVRELRKTEKNVLVLSSGEFFYGSSKNALHGSKLANILLPQLKLDAMSLSNHDFGRGILELSAFLYKMEFPILCANMQARNSTFLYSRVNKSVTLDLNGEKIGIVGFLHPQALDRSRFAASVKFYPELPAVKDEVEELERKGVNKIIALGHSGYYTDLEIARQVKGVDIVIGGSSDIVFEKTDDKDVELNGMPIEGNIYENYPRLHHHEVEAGSERFNKTLVLHVPQHGKYVGLLRVVFNDHGQIISEEGEPLLLDSSIPQDQEVLEFLKNARVTLEALDEDYRMPDKEEVFARTAVNLDGKPRNCRMKECTLGNLVTDAILHRADALLEEWGKVDAVVVNSGMIRYSIQAGNITMKELTHAFFLGDLMERVNVSGAELREMLERSVQDYDPGAVTASGAFLQMSGLKVEYDLSQPVGSRVKSLLVRCPKCLTNYIPIKPNKTYFIVMPGFIKNGNDGYKNFSPEDYDIDYGQPDFLLLVDYLREVGDVQTKIDGRISFYKNYEKPRKSEYFHQMTEISQMNSRASNDEVKRSNILRKEIDQQKPNRGKTEISENTLDTDSIEKALNSSLGNAKPNFPSSESQSRELLSKIEEIPRKESLLIKNETKSKLNNYVAKNESHSSQPKVKAAKDSFRLANESSELKRSILSIELVQPEINSLPFEKFSFEQASISDSLSDISQNKHEEDNISKNTKQKKELPKENRISLAKPFLGAEKNEELKPFSIFQIANSSLGNLERILLDAIIPEVKLNFTLLTEKTLIVLEEILKKNLKNFLKERIEVVTANSFEKFIPKYRETLQKSNQNPTSSEEMKDYTWSENSPEETTKKPRVSSSVTDFNLKDVEIMQDLLVKSIVDSILEKVMESNFDSKSRHGIQISKTNNFIKRTDSPIQTNVVTAKEGAASNIEQSILLEANEKTVSVPKTPPTEKSIRKVKDLKSNEITSKKKEDTSEDTHQITINLEARKKTKKM